MIKKQADHSKIESPVVQTRPKPKKREKGIEEPKVKASKELEKLTQFQEPTLPETMSHACDRSNRPRFLTAKDGRGKILLGDEYQAELPQFLS